MGLASFNRARREKAGLADPVVDAAPEKVKRPYRKKGSDVSPDEDPLGSDSEEVPQGPDGGEEPEGSGEE